MSRRLEDLLDSLGAIIWDMDLATLRIEFMSRYVVQLLGYPVDHWLTVPDFWQSVVHPDDLEGAFDFFKRSIEQRQDLVHEFRVITMLGGEVWLRTMTHVQMDERGQPLKLQGVAVDITDQKRGEQAEHFLSEVSRQLADSLDYDVTLARVAHLAVPFLADWCVVDLVEEDGSVRRVSVVHADPVRADLARQLQLDFAPVSGLPGTPPKGVQWTIQSGKATLVSRVTPAIEQDIARDSRHLHILRALGLSAAICVPMIARGRVIGALTFVSATPARQYGQAALALAEDLARRCALAVDNARLYRRAEQNAERMSSFLHLVSHEIQQPLAEAQIHAQLLRDGLGRMSAEHVRESIGFVEAATGRLNVMLQELVDSARFESQPLSLARAPIELTSFTRNFLRRTLGRPDAERARVEASEPVVAYADADKLDRVLHNLLSNALRYSDREKSVVVHLKAQEGEVVLSVADQGIGISPEDLPRLFERGFRSRSIVDRTSGMGLGLYITRLLVEAHGGRIWVESEPGRGSTFHVALPSTTVGST